MRFIFQGATLRFMLIKPKNYRKAEPQTMAESIEGWIKANHLDDKLLEARLVECWPEMLGVTVARHTKKISIEGRVLKILVDNAPLRHQLSMSKTRLIQLVNQKAGRQVVLECLIL